MSFLRRLLGGRPAPAEKEPEPLDPHEVDAAEREHALEVMQAERERFDELTQRQLRYEHYAWQPPAQGGDRRADDGDSSSG